MFPFNALSALYKFNEGFRGEFGRGAVRWLEAKTWKARFGRWFRNAVRNLYNQGDHYRVYFMWPHKIFLK